MKELFHRGDRAMIYIFIAASYFPWLTLLPLPDNTWTSDVLPIGVWVFALMGIVYQQLFHEKYKWLETLIYVCVGALPCITIVLEVVRNSR